MDRLCGLMSLAAAPGLHERKEAPSFCIGCLMHRTDPLHRMRVAEKDEGPGGSRITEFTDLRLDGLQGIAIGVALYASQSRNPS